MELDVSRGNAMFQVRGVILRIAFVNPHRFVPAIGDIRQL
jgi:hypothetical protein